ncbi:hypothetical protein M409DRAFT_18273 [Zasmidium cellare ATCC 36951]|uniref:Uncharacterized protein n=1 Tax=Zasmidium cellare ATCC 36951 TaxID=1080233 RepID=A0A6A6D1K4_ZASCE|nr:uncharacterized protein M409DRAFT_18273 [Zasmidium cellare ATCC 36951]KAF2172042.1 hypothetical protein M409DRAFT_18273 [Zasmidium cellare ATCC 36951]
MAESSQLSAVATVYGDLYKIMMNEYFAGDFESSDKLAYQLLRHADLPTLIRARCHMALATSQAPDIMDFKDHAEAAVKILKDAKEDGYVISERHLEEAERILESAKLDYEALKEALEEEEVEPGDGEAAAAEGEEEGEESVDMSKEEETTESEENTLAYGETDIVESEQMDTEHATSEGIEPEEDLPTNRDGRAGGGGGVRVSQGLLTSERDIPSERDDRGDGSDDTEQPGV